PEIRETKAYKTYLGYAIGVTPPKKARKFKKRASSKLSTILVSPEEPTRKSKKVMRPAKNSTNAPTAGVAIRETPMMSLSKKKEKVTIEKQKGIDFLSEVALAKEDQYEEIQNKSLRDFHKTHPSGSGNVTKIAPSAARSNLWDEDDINNDRDSSSEGNVQESDSGDNNTQSDNEKGSNSEHETDVNELGLEYDQERNEEDVEDEEEEKYDEFVKTPSNSTDNEDETNEAEVNIDEGLIPKKGTDAKWLTSIIPQSLPSFTPSPPKSTPPPTTKETNLLFALPNFASVFQFNNRVTALEKEVAKLKKDYLLNTQVTALVDKHLDLRLRATRDEFMSYLLASIIARITEQVTILPKEVSNFAPSMIKSMVTESLEHAVLAKESSQPKFTYEAAASLTE
nr:hypothetical protein [Tanacetum cinerariifolium]